jgi:hypothetical protein
MTEIAKCWFCGGDCVARVLGTEECHGFWIACESCGYEHPGDFRTEVEAILAHNNPPGVDAAKREAYAKGAKSGREAAMLKMGVTDGE